MGGEDAMLDPQMRVRAVSLVERGLAQVPRAEAWSSETFCGERSAKLTERLPSRWTPRL
jgi:hypothetical protein